MHKKHSIHALELGPMNNLVYFILDHPTQRVAVVDPAWDVKAINTLANTLGGTITDILLTHCHHDHINGIDELLQYHDAQLHLLREEHLFWDNLHAQPSLHRGGDEIQLGETCIKILHTPGHTVGSACYHIGDDLITGDTLFVFGCGHCRLAGADPEALFNTLQTIKHALPTSTIIHPGHHYAHKPVSTLAEQIQGNPFLHFNDLELFKRYRLVDHGRLRTTPYDSVPQSEIENLYKSR